MGLKDISYKILSVDRNNEELSKIESESFESMDIYENKDLHYWVIKNPEEMLLEDILIIENEYSKFKNIRKRPDILGVDRYGKLVIIEVKRDEADINTDIQAVSYAGYCSIITSEQIQHAYLQFRNERFNEGLEPEDVGETFSYHLEDSKPEIALTDEGWADFNLDNKPRILLLASAFPTEVTSPIMWLRQEYGLDIECITIHPYRHEDKILLNTRQVIPLPESEDYMAKISEKTRKQESTDRRPSAVKVLFDKGVLKQGDIIEFNKSELKYEYTISEDLGDSFWKAKALRKEGYNNFKWCYNDEEYSATGMSKELIEELTGEEQGSLQGPAFWCHPEFGGKSLSELRDQGVEASDRQST